MPLIAYIEKKFHRATMEVIEQANAIIEEYAAQGFDLTLRQLYYQFVARGLIPNSDKEYKKLGNIINDARLAGLIDWDHITDRTRNLRSNPHWDRPNDIIHSAAYSYAIDKWQRQEYRPEVWIEKDALVGVIAGICQELDVPYFSCRGYTSQSEMWSAAQRLDSYYQKGQTPIIFHLGDHDPSGKDMTRDIIDRLQLFMGYCDVERLALNWDQIEEYNPPPNPAKLTDTRATAYIADFGYESWELDALDPNVIVDLVRTAIENIRDENAWNEAIEEEETVRKSLHLAASRWRAVEKFLNGSE